jgi:hypothetical protein
VVPVLLRDRAFFLGRIRPAEPPADDGEGSVTAGARIFAGSAIVRASSPR